MSLDDLESRIESKTSAYAESLGILTLKLNVKGRAGWPDRLYLFRGHIWFVEFKRAGENPRKLQTYIHNQLRQQGAVVKLIDNLIDGRSMINELYNLPPVRP